jgi:hypothetical protein
MTDSGTRSVQAAVDTPVLQDVTLHVAAAAGQLATVREMICAGAPVDRLDPKGRTALHYAVEAGQYEIITISSPPRGECQSSRTMGSDAVT